MILDPMILSIFILGFQKVVAKPTAQEDDSGNFGMDFNQSVMPFNGLSMSEFRLTQLFGVSPEHCYQCPESYK